ncbi:class I SAM-dependent methyltransferase [Paraburkholderia sp. MMS20-SJTN17]|uniref:Class I SAM-dependent methyltransferase n=1 Tax=Paraburkholderia translucens TaxID=2886945 RepID=A0ABS8KMI1_9BURK|nr:class I SAM-dependent methyltransferase [Paraburkholderia sp. MMS20-SJTN17]MCC8405956.1 class I SAM-dependent methyltransferase [Paraburkholderia sp. MMS20-SJTN17]
MTSQVEAYLKDFHLRQVGTTRRAYSAYAARSGQAEYLSSYHALAERVPNDELPRIVLDLACGDGPLLEILSDRDHTATKLIGIDMSDGELVAARAVLPPNIRLINERAQELSLETGSVDYVLSHMALMLMDDIEQVMREIRRVLRKGGRFAAVVGRAFLLGEVGEAFLNVFRPIANAHLTRLRFGDSRTRCEAGWRELLQQGFANIAFEDIDVEWTPTPEQLWQSMLETYDTDRMSDAGREQFKSELLTAVAPMQREDGTLKTGWALRLVQASAA